MAYTGGNHPKRWHRGGLGSRENTQVVWNTRSAAEKSFDRVTVWGVLSALALGALLGGIGVLCSRWVNDSPLLSAALRSAFSAMALVVLASASPQDLVLETRPLQTYLRNGHSSTNKARGLCGQRVDAQPGFMTARTNSVRSIKEASSEYWSSTKEDSQ